MWQTAGNIQRARWTKSSYSSGGRQTCKQINKIISHVTCYEDK